QIQLNNYVFNFAQQENFEAKLTKEVRRIIAQNKLEEVYPEKVQKKLLTQLSSDWYRSFLLLDPAKYLSQVNCPILALNGENDKQVAADTNLKAIQRAVSTKDLLYTKKYPQLNHLFQSSEKGTPEEYYQIEETFSESVMKDIYLWIRTQLK
ncbi:MAG: prolyl oligopeptidase family serine peptidase, partial [Bacteroides sp.]